MINEPKIESYNEFSYKYEINKSFLKDDIDDLLKDYNITSIRSDISDSEDGFSIIRERITRVKGDIHIIYDSIKSDEVTHITSNILIYSRNHTVDIDTLINTINDKALKQTIITDKMNILCVVNGRYELEPIDITDFSIDTQYYNSESIKNINKIIKDLDKGNYNSLNIIYGERGIGKTHLLYHIANTLDRQCIFIPNNLIDLTVNNPEFINFMIEYQNCVIMIDDCESIFNDFFMKSAMVSNNIIQMLDSPLTLTLSFDIFLVFNTSLNTIDNNLLNCNSVTTTKIDLLTESESNDLSKRIGSKSLKGKNKLIDILKKRKGKKESIGF